jgi:hypothetical protein
VLAVSGVSQAGPNVRAFKLGKICQDFGFAGAVSKLAKNIINGNPQPPDRRLATALSGLDGNPCYRHNQLLFDAGTEASSFAAE